MTSSKHVEEMNSYKGGALPSPVIPLSGLALGLVLPLGVKTILQPASKSGVDGIVDLVSHLPVLSGLFFAEFLFGAAARSLSTKASFSPAAAAATNQVPVELVEANRIHQNHIENLLIFLPLAMAASTKDSGLAVCCTISWVIARFLYRIGYTNKKMPFWRISGVSASMAQSILCGCVCMGWNVIYM